MAGLALNKTQIQQIIRIRQLLEAEEQQRRADDTRGKALELHQSGS